MRHSNATTKLLAIVGMLALGLVIFRGLSGVLAEVKDASSARAATIDQIIEN